MKTSTPRSEAEIRALQEKKNYEEFIYDTNQALQNLDIKQKQLSNKQQKLEDQAASDKVIMQLGCENFKEAVIIELKDNKRLVNDFGTSMLKLVKECDTQFDFIAGEYLPVDEFNEFVSSVQALKDDIKKVIQENRAHCDASLNFLQGRIESEAHAVRRDLTPNVPEVDPIDKAIKEAFLPYDIDFEGMQKEIALLKKAVHYNEKKFEYLETLMKRKEES